VLVITFPLARLGRGLAAAERRGVVGERGEVLCHARGYKPVSVCLLDGENACESLPAGQVLGILASKGCVEVDWLAVESRNGSG